MSRTRTMSSPKFISKSKSRRRNRKASTMSVSDSPTPVKITPPRLHVKAKPPCPILAAAIAEAKLVAPQPETHPLCFKLPSERKFPRTTTACLERVCVSKCPFCKVSQATWFNVKVETKINPARLRQSWSNHINNCNLETLPDGDPDLPELEPSPVVEAKSKPKHTWAVRRMWTRDDVKGKNPLGVYCEACGAWRPDAETGDSYECEAPEERAKSLQAETSPHNWVSRVRWPIPLPFDKKNPMGVFCDQCLTWCPDITTGDTHPCAEWPESKHSWVAGVRWPQRPRDSNNPMGVFCAHCFTWVTDIKTGDGYECDKADEPVKSKTEGIDPLKCSVCDLTFADFSKINPDSAVKVKWLRHRRICGSLLDEPAVPPPSFDESMSHVSLLPAVSQGTKRKAPGSSPGEPKPKRPLFVGAEVHEEKARSTYKNSLEIHARRVKLGEVATAAAQAAGKAFVDHAACMGAYRSSAEALAASLAALKTAQQAELAAIDEATKLCEESDAANLEVMKARSQIAAKVILEKM